jgi:hypothetical protein
MRDDGPGPIGKLLAMERRFYALMPGKDLYSKLFFRTLLWFTLFSVAYTLAIGL